MLGRWDRDDMWEMMRMTRRWNRVDGIRSTDHVEFVQGGTSFFARSRSLSRNSLLLILIQ